MAQPQLTALLQLRGQADSRVGPARVQLLAAIARHGSISAAAKEVGLSYKGAWDSVQALNNLSERPLVSTQPGGRSGGAAVVTPEGLALVAAFDRLQAELSAAAERLGHALAAGAVDDVLWSLSMKTTARNALSGVVSEVKDGAVNCEVILKVSPCVEVVAIVSRESVQELDLKPGRRAVALITSTFVLLAAAGEPLRTSARNRFSGAVVRHERGAVNDEVVLEIDQGKTITATITRVSADELDVSVGQPLQALVKASHVILAVG